MATVKSTKERLGGRAKQLKDALTKSGVKTTAQKKKAAATAKKKKPSKASSYADALYKKAQAEAKAEKAAKAAKAKRKGPTSRPNNKPSNKATIGRLKKKLSDQRKKSAARKSK